MEEKKKVRANPDNDLKYRDGIVGPKQESSNQTDSDDQSDNIEYFTE